MRIANKYDIIDELGRGGMGRVYRVRHVQLNTVFALKTLLPQFAADASVVARFQHEARVVARLQHPNIVRVFDIDRDGDQYFIVMEYIAGQSLAERLKTKGPYAPAEALAIAGQVGAALAYAHARQPAVVHRDIKPSNIMIEDASGRVVVTDFGIAKILDPEQPGLTGTGMMVGSFRYCAPEQLEADPHLDARADIFSFGLVLYELLAGRPFFEGLSYSEVVRRQLYDPHEHAPVLPATTPAVWRAVIARAIAKDRERRYATVAELLGALQAAPPDSATRPQPEPAPPAPRRRVVLALGACAALAIWRWLSVEAPQPSPSTPLPSPAPVFVAPEMVAIKGGCYAMGSPDSEAGRNQDERQHTVCVRDFFLGRWEVTFADYDRFAAASGRARPADQGWGRANRPVINVSWDDASAYTAWLARQTGAAYRLPSEAEWEYAARAGTTAAHYWADDQPACGYANVGDQTAQNGAVSFWEAPHACSDGYVNSAPVASFKANAFGLYDMLGNVWEWTCSAYQSLYKDALETRCATDPSAPRVLRGGSWLSAPAELRAANRQKAPAAYQADSMGFRVAKDG